MRIEYLKLENFKGVKNLQIDFSGNNAAIYGENGTGKTSIFDAYTWLLSGKMSDGKTCEVGKNAAVEMKIDGLKLRRENGVKSAYYVRGVQCSFTDFKISVAHIFKNSVLLAPFKFCELNVSERRNLLLKLFATDLEISGKFSAIEEQLKTLTPEQIIKLEIQTLKKLDRELMTIPARISELQLPASALDFEALNAEIKSLTAQINSKLEEINSKDTAQLEKSLSELRANFAGNEATLKNLREDFATVQNALSGKCPLCGNKISAPNLGKLQTRLSEIIAQGKELSQKQELLKKAAQVAREKLSALPKNDALAERDILQEKLAQAKIKRAEARRYAENQQRIEQLKAREVELGVLKNQCDKKIFQAENYLRQKITLTEKAINSHFEFVEFRMYEPYKVAEGVKEICEPFLNGVPYAALSKGEKLKASLDILKTLQKAFELELPLFIDDAESYTSNSFINLPNQIILLKVAEGVKQLQVEIFAERKMTA